MGLLRFSGLQFKHAVQDVFQCTHAASRTHRPALVAIPPPMQGARSLNQRSLPGLQVGQATRDLFQLAIYAVLSRLKSLQLFNHEAFSVFHGYRLLPRKSRRIAAQSPPTVQAAGRAFGCFLHLQHLDFLKINQLERPAFQRVGLAHDEAAFLRLGVGDVNGELVGAGGQGLQLLGQCGR